jgi:hypothetical protein
MAESKDLLLVNERLRRSNRRWKALALAACAVVILAVLFGVATAERQRRQVEAAQRDANAALAIANQTRVDAQRAVSPGQPN